MPKVKTRFGDVVISDQPYFSHTKVDFVNSISMTTEESQGWAVLREIPASIKLTNSMIDEFAETAVGYL